MTDPLTDLKRLLDALDAWIKSEGLTPPPYVQREIDRHEPKPRTGGGPSNV